MAGVERAAILMGTDNNKPLLADYGFVDPSIDEAGVSDLIICLEAIDEKTLNEAISSIEKLLKERGKRTKRGKRFASLEGAYESVQDANLAVISVPGQFAGREARKAIVKNLNVFLFSDNVPLEEEIELKQLASEKKLLLMGPDCGTAIIDGVGLGFANSVRKGPVGIVGAAGTGIQELCVILERFGNLGISHAIGIGGRDLSDSVQGMAASQGLELLDQDRKTRCIIFISKPPSEGVSTKIVGKMRRLSKPSVICFLGKSNVCPAEEDKNLLIVESIEQAALAAIQLLGFAVNQELMRSSEEIESLARREGEKLKPDQRFVRAIFSGGSFCFESMALLSQSLDNLHSNTPIPGVKKLADSLNSLENTFLDMGEDEFTRGRVHPMIDPTPISDRIRAEAKDPTVGVILFDIILGHGTHPDPASVLGPAVRDVKRESEKHNRHLVVTTHVCGTDGDPQGRIKQEEQLKKAGALVLNTNLQATMLVSAILGERLR
jgi:succinyl-CoA synthetase alpha subunit